jgi:8-oxo-dGTP diphosphatase
METKYFYDFLIKIQSIAKIVLVHSKDPYALTNYEEINKLSTEMLEKFMEVNFDRPNYFQRDIYPTPNVSVRTVIFNEDKTKVLLVRETSEQAYCLPGGWADLYDSPKDTAINECRQEAGANIEVIRLVGVMNRTPFKAKTSVPEYVLIFEAKLIGELKEHEYETDDVNFFDVNNLPNLSRKVSKEEVERMIFSARDELTIFD